MPFRVTLPLLLVIAFPALGLVAGRQTLAGRDDTIVVVSSLPRSGSARGQTDTIVNGILLAFSEVDYKIDTQDPATGARRTFRIEYRDLDDATAAAGQWTIEQEIANANLAKTDPDVMVYIGTYNSGAAKVSMPILNRANLLMISPANTATPLTKPCTGGAHEPMCYRPSGEVNYTRCIPTDDLQSANAAYWCRDMGIKKVYILDDSEVYGKGIATPFGKKCQELGITVLGQQSIDAKAQEFSPLMTSIKALGPELVYFGGTTQTKAGQLMKDLVKVGMRCPMMGPDGCYEQAMVDGAGVETCAAVPFYATFGGLPVEALTAGRGKQFVENYTKKFGAEPTEAYATYGYECGLAAIEAIRLAGVKDRDAIRKAGLSIRDFEGATGKWSFDANGDSTNQTMSGNVIRDGKFRFVKPLALPK